MGLFVKQWITDRIKNPSEGGGGGEVLSPLRIVVLDTVVDLIDQDEFVDVLSLSLESDSIYKVEGYCRSFNATEVDLMLSLPVGATFTGTHTQSLGGSYDTSFWDGARIAGDFSYYGMGATVTFSGVIDTGATAGDVKIRACQQIASMITTEIPVGTWLQVIKAQ